MQHWLWLGSSVRARRPALHHHLLLMLLLQRQQLLLLLLRWLVGRMHRTRVRSLHLAVATKMGLPNWWRESSGAATRCRRLRRLSSDRGGRVISVADATGSHARPCWHW